MSSTRIRLGKQIEKAPAINMIPLSDVIGELQYTTLLAAVRSAETLTHLNSVEITNGNLIIKYTAEDNVQQVVSTPLVINATDINVSNAVLENPGAGIYRLVITESDASQHIVDLSSLVAMVSQNSAEITLTGNGTPASPLTAALTQAYKDSLPKTINALDDVITTQVTIDAATEATGLIALCWDTTEQQWKPKNAKTIKDFVEYTQVFRGLAESNYIMLDHPTNLMVPQSLKVFRNGLRQDLGEDYTLGGQGSETSINFPIAFSSNTPETVIVDYRLL